MPVQNGDYVQLTATEITSALESELQAEFGQDIDLTEGSVFSTLAEVLAAVLANNQEASLSEVYDAAFLETATGVDLEKLVALIGISRRAAIHATGAVRFDHDGPVAQDYTIQSGTIIQTDSDTPVEFETTEVARLEYIDGFEDGDIGEYSGDTGDASVVQTNVRTGGDALQFGATNGSHIYRDDITLYEGSVHHCYVRPETNTVPVVTFFVQADDVSDYYQVSVDHANDEARLERVDDGSIGATLDTATGVGITAGEYHEVKIEPTLTGNRNITILDDGGNELATLSATDETYTEGFPGFKSGDAVGDKQFDDYTTSQVSANVRAVVGGVDGNIGPNTLTILPSPPSGVDNVTNLYPTGDSTYEDRDQQVFVSGNDEETDTELRNRAQEAVTGGGKATHDALVSELVNSVTGVRSVTVIENKTDTDNTGSGGLPPHSFEAVVFGGDDSEIAEAIHETKAITARDYGGANGTQVQVVVTADSNGQQRTISFSRPNSLDIDLTLDLVINDNYIGDDALRNRIVEYIGGTLSDGSDAVGLDVGEDVIIDVVRDVVVGEDDTGVVAFDNSVDGTPVSTTPAITTVDGIEVVDVGSNEVAQTDATDASITLNTRNP